VLGIEVNPYAAELARVTIWIGELQWMIENGFSANKNPVLKPLDQIECRDAILNENGTEPDWPKADAIVGNPPFLGDKKMIGELGEPYVAKLRSLYSGRVPGGADLCCYWFNKARVALLSSSVQLVGLVATNSIRGGANRAVLDAITDVGRIFSAQSDESWVNEGAAVRVSLVCFAHKKWQSAALLDGRIVNQIYADLTAPSSDVQMDFTSVRKLYENAGVSFQGSVIVGPFDVDGQFARAWLVQPANPSGFGNADVLRPIRNGRDLMSRPRDRWVINFFKMSESEAAGYEGPFEYALAVVAPVRKQNRRVSRAKHWWRHGETGDGWLSAVSAMKRYVATSQVAKHRVFCWLDSAIQPHQTVIVMARDDDTFFGIVSSRLHVVWSERLGTSLEDRPRYTPTTVFDTFPFPKDLSPNISAAEYAENTSAQRIAPAGARLNELRENWLNPPELVERVPEVVPGYPVRLVPKSPEAERTLKKRTLTNLYNEKPAWLQHAHRELDEAVAAAYGWVWPLADEEILKRLFELNQERAGARKR
jgi:type II restriction/modification system DNA methylase subunit YeeA